MTRVRYDNPCPAKNFEEHIDFSWDVPYTVRVKTFSIEDIVPMHYAKTLEILVCKDLRGAISINGKSYPLDTGNQVFVITPYVLHSSEILPCGGAQYVIKLDFEMLGNFLNVNNLLAYDNQRIEWLNEHPACFDRVFSIALGLIEQDDNIFACMGLLSALIDVLRRDCSRLNMVETNDNSAQNAKLRELILWTEERYAEKISIDDAANAIGYSKYYFCTYFKRMTGISYLDYLNHVRIYNACRLLRAGEAAQSVCNAVGFESISYFSRLFKRIQGISPKLYVELATESAAHRTAAGD